MTTWIDASAGASGDMLLGALVGAGVPVDVLQRAVDAIAPEPVKLRVEEVTRGGLAATRCQVDVADSVHHRTWRDIEALLNDADLDDRVAHLALRVFERLAGAEARAHGHDIADVHFHEVGALDAIADIVGASAGFVHLGETEVVVSPVAVGSGHVRGTHGTLPVPPPAVAELLRGVPSYAGPPGAPAMELCTPTGAAILTTVATSWGPQPLMATTAIGIGAGTRNPAGHANVVRILVGDGSRVGGDTSILLETNVDDLDPRVWPSVITALLDAGASDAWLTPILMKKGRPAHTLIGLREQVIGKRALERTVDTVEVEGQRIAVKIARHDGAVVNAQPEYDDVARAADALGRPVADVLATAIAATHTLLEDRN
jgi:pyridinium-3,5-bisthiocarboxylic acid mononucleotide nickel chelatase